MHPAQNHAIHAVHHLVVELVQRFGTGVVRLDQVVEHVSVDADPKVFSVFSDQESPTAQCQPQLENALRRIVDAHIRIKCRETLLQQHFCSAVLVDRKVKWIGRHGQR